MHLCRSHAPIPWRHVFAKPSKAQQEATCYHLTRCFAKGGRLRPPNPPAHCFWAASEQAYLCKTPQEVTLCHPIRCFADGRGLRPPPPPPPRPPGPAHIHHIRRQDLAALSRKRHVLLKRSKAQQETTCYHLTRCFANGGRLPPPQPPRSLFLDSF